MEKKLTSRPMLANLWNACRKRHTEPSREECAALLAPHPHSFAHTCACQLAVTHARAAKPGREAFCGACTGQHPNFWVHRMHVHAGNWKFGCRLAHAQWTRALLGIGAPTSWRPAGPRAISGMKARTRWRKRLAIIALDPFSPFPEQTWKHPVWVLSEVAILKLVGQQKRMLESLPFRLKFLHQSQRDKPEKSTAEISSQEWLKNHKWKLRFSNKTYNLT